MIVLFILLNIDGFRVIFIFYCSDYDVFFKENVLENNSLVSIVVS